MNHRPGWVGHLGLVEHAVDGAFLADLLDVAQRLLLDRREAAGDVALGRLRFGEVGGAPAVDHVLVAVEHEHEALAHRIVGAARRDDVLAAGDLGGLAEDQGGAERMQLVEGVADGRVGAAAGSGVGLAALGGDPQVGDRAVHALQRGRVLHEFLGCLRRAHDRVVVAVAFDAEADHRLAGLGDAVDDTLGPAVLDADHDHRGDVRIGAGADQRLEVQVEVGAELQPAVGMRDRHRSLDGDGHRFGGGIGQVVERQDDDVVAHADAAVFAPIAAEGGVLVDHCHVGSSVVQAAYQRLVLMLWTWACSPALMGATTLPMSMPYL